MTKSKKNIKVRDLKPKKDAKGGALGIQSAKTIQSGTKSVQSSQIVR